MSIARRRHLRFPAGITVHFIAMTPGVECGKLRSSWAVISAVDLKDN